MPPAGIHHCRGCDHVCASDPHRHLVAHPYNRQRAPLLAFLALRFESLWFKRACVSRCSMSAPVSSAFSVSLWALPYSIRSFLLTKYAAHAAQRTATGNHWSTRRRGTGLNTVRGHRCNVQASLSSKPNGPLHQVHITAGVRLLPYIADQDLFWILVIYRWQNERN